MSCWWLDAGTITAIFTAVAAVAALASVMAVKRQTRATLQVQSLLQLDDRWWSGGMRETRKAAAKALLEKKYDSSVGRVLDFFETLAGLFVKGKVLSNEWAHHTFYWYAVCYWSKSRDPVKSLNLTPSEKRAWEDLDEMMPKWIDYDVKQGGARPTDDDIDNFLQEELDL